MPEENVPASRPQTPIIESPSGTTDPDNSNSGVSAYVIFAIAIALLAVTLLSLSSCVSAVGTFVANDIAEKDETTLDSDDLETLDELTDRDFHEDGFPGGEPLSHT